MSKKIDDDFEPFDFKNLDEMLKRLFGNIGELPNLSRINPNTHHHSISYRFGAGMDKPEIRLNGEKLDDVTINNLFKFQNKSDLNLQGNSHLNSTDNLPELDAREISVPDTFNPSAPQYESTFFEVEQEEKAILITIELPGVDKNSVIVSQTGNKVSIIGENEFTSYIADFETDKIIDNSKTEINGNNSIYQIRLIQDVTL